MSGSTRAPLAGVHAADVCVLGGGLAGCAAALEAARRGARVAVLEAGAVGSSERVSLGHIVVGLGSPYVSAVQRWGRDAAREEWATHAENHERLREHVAALGTPCAYERRGGFAVALDRGEAAALMEGEDLLRDDGFGGEFLDHYMLEARVDVRGLMGGDWSGGDGAVDERAFVRALAAAAEAAGAVIFEESPVRRVGRGPSGVTAETPAGRIDAGLGIVAGGVPARTLVPFLAERLRPLPMETVSIVADRPLRIPTPAYAAGGRLVWRAWPDRLVVGACDGDPEAFARAHFPGATGPVHARWSGTLETTDDGLPLLGPIPAEPLFSAASVAGVGCSHALLAARWAAEFATTGRDDTPARYRASRAGAGGA